MTDKKCFSPWPDCPYQDEFLCNLWRSDDLGLSIHPIYSDPPHDQRAMKEAKLREEYFKKHDKPDLSEI